LVPATFVVVSTHSSFKESGRRLVVKIIAESLSQHDAWDKGRKMKKILYVKIPKMHFFFQFYVLLCAVAVSYTLAEPPVNNRYFNFDIFYHWKIAPLPFSHGWRKRRQKDTHLRLRSHGDMGNEL
jgi:hypothetical protein